jgi:hypothetical protein
MLSIIGNYYDNILETVRKIAKPTNSGQTVSEERFEPWAPQIENRGENYPTKTFMSF